MHNRRLWQSLQFECHLMREIDLGRLELLNELSDVDKSD